MALNICTVGDPVLRQTARRLSAKEILSPTLLNTILDRTFYDYRDLINPQIELLSSSSEVSEYEGCLSS